MNILPNPTRVPPASPTSLLTHGFAEEMAERLLAAALKALHNHPAQQILHAHSYFTLYARELASGAPSTLVLTDAPAWLQEALSLLEEK